MRLNSLILLITVAVFQFHSSLLACAPLPPSKAVEDIVQSGYVGTTCTIFDGTDKYYCPDYGQIVEYQWVLPPQAYCIEGDRSSQLKCKFAEAGIYEIELQVKCSHGIWNTEHAGYPLQNRFIYQLTIQAVQGPWYVSPTGNDSNNGQSWETAFRNIQTAIDSAANNNEIIVRSGTAEISVTYHEQLDLKGKSLNIHSEYPEDWSAITNTIIDAQKHGTAIVFRGNETDPSAGQNFKGFTIRNGGPAGDGCELKLEFDDNTVTDSSDRERPVSVLGATWLQEGVMSFDGDDYIEITDYKGVVGRNSRTFSAWVKTSQSTYSIFCSWGYAGTGQKWMLGAEASGELSVGCWNGKIVGTDKIKDGNWHHVAAVLEDDHSPNLTEIRLYVDGVLQTTTCSNYTGNPPTVNTETAENVHIGARFAEVAGVGPAYYAGVMDDVRIYSRALSNKEIYALAGPILSLEMDAIDEASSTPDDSRFENDGLVTGVQIVADGVGGSSALRFASTGSYIQYGSIPELDLANKITLATWMKIDDPDYNGVMRIISKKTSWDTADGYQLEYKPYDNIIVLLGSGTNYCSANVDLDTNWHHIVAVANGTTGKIYVDGIDCTTDSTMGQVVYNTVPLCIGRQTNGTSCQYMGVLDKLRIYSRALTQNEIIELSDSSNYLTGYWELDGNANDSAGNYHGTSYGNPTWPTGHEGQAIGLDGIDDYIDFGDLNLTGRPKITICGWIKPDEVNDYDTVIGNSQGGGLATVRFNMDIHSNRLRVVWGDGVNFDTFYSATNAFSASQIGKWSHVAFISDGASASFYVNGQQSGSAATITRNLASSSVGWTLGRGFDSNSFLFKGLIDNVQVYGRPLTANEINALAGRTRKIIAHYKLDGDCVDSAGTYDGSLVGSEAVEEEGIIGSAWKFNGNAGNYIQLAPLFDPSRDKFSVFTWVRLDDPAGNDSQTILAQEDGTGTGRPILARQNGTNGTNLLFSRLGGIDTFSKTAIFATTGQWHHVGVTYDGQYVRLYIDGVREASELRTGESTDGGLRVAQQKEGISYANQAPWGGAIDDLRIYNYSLTDAEVQSLYQTRFADGGGIRGNGADAALSNNSIKENTSQVNGGGVAQVDGTISNCFITNNVSETNGGGLANCNGNIVNCVIAENTAVNAGAFLGDTAATIGSIVNCTIANNVASASIGGIKDYSRTITNTILWGNTDIETATTIEQAQISGGSPDVDFSCIQDGTIDNTHYSGEANIDDDPAFVSSESGDYHVYPGSPCRNEGDPSGNYTGQTDMDGQTRISNERVDIGADEETSNIIYVDINTPDPITPDGSSWEEAFPTIQAAIDAASTSPGQVIVVKQGIYLGTVNFCGKPIHLMSTNPINSEIVSVTVLGTSANPVTNRVVFQTQEGNGSILDGFVVQYGTCGVYAKGMNGPVSPIIQNCIIQNNSQYGVLAHYASSPTIQHCTIRNNAERGISIQSTLANASTNSIIQNCEVKDNSLGGIHASASASHSSVMIENCVIANNDTGIFPNGVQGIYLDVDTAEIVNCTIVKHNANASYNCSGIQLASDFVKIRNCILWDNKDDISTYQEGNVSISYCCIKDTDIQEEDDECTGIIHLDPLFKDFVNGDYHLKSHYGTWNQAISSWEIYNDQYSPCIDAGDPQDDYSKEVNSPAGTNGGRINMGAYGNTRYASKSADIDRDGLSDSWEHCYFRTLAEDPEDNSEASFGSSADEFTNSIEYYFNYNPAQTTQMGPEIASFSQTTNTFDPTVGQTVSFTFILNKPCRLRLRSIDTQDVFFEQGSQVDPMPAGQCQIAWNGTALSDSLIIEKGFQNWKLETTDATSVQILSSVTNDYDGLEPINLTYGHLVNSLHCNPKRVIPTFGEVVNLAYIISLSDLLNEWPMIISVYDPHGHLFFSTLLDGDNTPGAGNNSYVWHGKTRPVDNPAGRYPIEEGEYMVEVRFLGMREHLEDRIDIYR